MTRDDGNNFAFPKTITPNGNVKAEERLTIVTNCSYNVLDQRREATNGLVTVHTNVWFSGKLIRAEGDTVFVDRVGSVISEGEKYYPYGEECTDTAQDHTKFATYYRDATTALDYADQRYYGRTMGRFLTADWHIASGGTADSGRWNRYSYVQNDPVNFNDPSGLFMAWFEPWDGGGASGFMYCLNAGGGWTGGWGCYNSGSSWDPTSRFDEEQEPTPGPGTGGPAVPMVSETSEFTSWT